MSELPALPSSMQNAQPLANSVGADATALAAPTSLALRLDGPKFKAASVISAKEAAARKAHAHKLVRDPGFDALYLSQLVRRIPLDTSTLEMVLEKTRALNVGEVGDLTVKAAMYMNRLSDKLPAPPDERFIKLMKSGKMKAGQMIARAKIIAAAVEKWLRMYDDMLKPFTDVKVQLSEKYDLMVTDVVLNKELAKNEDGRTDTLAQDTALLEYVLEALPGRVDELKAQAEKADDKQSIEQEITRLNGMKPLIVKTIMTLNPLIFVGYAAVDRYLGLSNMAGGRALTLGIFLSAGIARWESDVVTEIQTLNQLASGLALAKADEFMQRQAGRSSEAYIKAIEDYVALMNRWSLVSETMQKISDDTEKAKNALVEGFRALSGESGKVASAVEDAMKRINEGKAKYNREMEAITN